MTNSRFDYANVDVGLNVYRSHFGLDYVFIRFKLTLLLGDLGRKKQVFFYLGES